MNKILILLMMLISLLFVGCGSWDRTKASMVGYSESCVDGVSYLQFTSGVTVKYLPDGKVATCK